MRASRQTQHETSCLEEPRGGKLLGRAENFAPPWGATWLPGAQGGGQTLGEQSGPENFAPPGAQPGCLEARGGGKLLVPKNLAPPWGATGDL